MRRYVKPPELTPNKEHASNLADLVHNARIKADEEQRLWFEALCADEEDAD
jgi:hypothetical protein